MVREEIEFSGGNCALQKIEGVEGDERTEFDVWRIMVDPEGPDLRES